MDEQWIQNLSDIVAFLDGASNASLVLRGSKDEIYEAEKGDAMKSPQFTGH